MRILLTRYGGIGDLIYIEPVIRAIKEKYNPTEIIFRTHKGYNCGEVTVQLKEVFKENPFISAVVFDSNCYELGIETYGLCVENLVPKNLEKWGLVNPYFDMHINFQGAIEKNIDNPNLHAVDSFANAANVKVKDRIPKIYYDQKIVPKYELVVQLKSAGEDRDLSKNNDLIEIISKSNLTKIFLGDKNLNYHEFVSIIANCKIFIGTESCGTLIATGLNKKVITIFKNEIRIKNRSYENAMNITQDEIVKFKSEILNYITEDEKMNETSKCLESRKKAVTVYDPSVINIKFSPSLFNPVDDNKPTYVSAISLSEIVDKNKLIDIVIVSYAKNEYCESLTRDCINSLLLSEPNAESIFNIIVVESNPSVKWEKMSPCVVTYEAVLPYGYHKFLNYGRKKGNSEWVALCNNDLQFTEGWFSKILQASSIDPSVLSFSPLCPLTQANLENKGLVYGYQVRQEISGWCIVQKRSIYNIIGDLDEDFYHWNCDSDYSMTLFKNEIKHVLVTDSVVIHHNQNTGKTTENTVESDSEMHRLTIACRDIFNKKYPIRINKETLTRYDIINKIIELNSYANYLEIGINNGLCFKKINCSKKTGVDPNSDHATYKMTSDDFFETLKPEDKFDIIFIDGLHLEMQVDKDIENSIKYLKENGTIILHDCNPPSEYHAKENIYFGGPISGEWNGTVYKSLVKIRSKRNDLTLTTVDTDYGVGILTKEPSETIKTCSDTWDFFDANRKEILNLITPKQFEKIYNKSKKTFHEIWDSMSHYSFMGLNKTKIVYEELLDTFDLEGHTAEIGVYKGHTSKLIHELCKHKTHYCYDTFSGIELSDSNIDFHKNGEFSCALNDVKNLLGENNIVYKVGVFPNTFNEGSEKFSFVHSDTDTYAGTKATLDYFAPIMVDSGKILFDDYKWENCKGVEKAIKEFMNDNHSFTLKEYDGQCGQCVLTKKPVNRTKELTFEVASNKKIGLCMIVKNESKIIERCLNSVKPLIDYVCIIDTGSTDDTVNVINNWMQSNNVDGEVVFEPWKDFAYNRSLAMEKIREKKHIDYALMIDADEILMYEEGINFLKIKESLNCDLYNITCKLGNIEYARTSITKNDMPYFYKGVVHEYLECKEHIKTRETIKGIYNIPFQDSARNQNIEKYQHDAKVLQDTLKIETNPFLISRYTFYLAQSYRDSLEKEKAIYWYNKRSKLGFWDQEIYISLYKVAKLKEELEYPEDDIIQSYMRAHEICPERIEAIHGAVSFCRRHGRNHQAYTLSKHAISIPVNKTGLFSENWIWDYGIYDEFTISCYWSGHYKEGLEVSEKLISKIPEEQKERILKNIGYLKEKLNSK